MAKPLVAIVGRPNVGKSALFNRIIRSRVSIVDDSPGITRDRIYGDAEWCGRTFAVVDTGGIETDPPNDISAKMRVQAELAIAQADVLVFVVDSRCGITSEDQEVANILRRARKPVVVAANKVDDPRHFDYGLYALGLGEPIAVSAVHGIGIGDLLDAIADGFPEKAALDEAEDERIRIAVIGRPNVGKSSIVNRILGEERSIVSDLPGTTRDAIDSSFEFEGEQYAIVDTAGIRKHSKVSESVERYSVLRALRAVDRCDVAVTVLDGTEDPATQDTKIAGYAHDAGKAAVIAVNKWDIVERKDATAREYESKVRDLLQFMPYAPVVFVSAITGRRISKLLETICTCAGQHRRRVQTSLVNKVIEDAVLRNPPPDEKGKQIRILYAAQVSAKPPRFVVFSNYPEYIHFSYKRFLENVLRDSFEFVGTPIEIALKRRE
ncbi:MAG: ribosome biogenesis GTPase Der [Clostridia bacterium]|nr:ribosome biogenesis GTPase Der [Clostridia bacterium]